MKRIIVFAALGLILCNAYALTPQERKVLTQARTEIRAGKAQYDQSRLDLAAAQKETADALNHIQVTEGANATLAQGIKREHTENVANAAAAAKYKPVYDACTRWFGAGAIVFGVKDLLKHMLWFALGAGVLVIALYALSFAFPIFGVFLAVFARVFKGIFGAIATAFRALEAHLKA